MIKNEIVFYTDGACSQNGTWAGGYGVIELSENSINFYKSEFCEKTTNNKEELKAMLEALKRIDNYIETSKENNKYIIYTDSAYVYNSCNTWIYGWAKNNWKNSKKVTVENVNLMQEIYKYLTKNFNNCQISIRKIKGHEGTLGNELADALASNNDKKWRDLINKYLITCNIECFCPICDKMVMTKISGGRGHCPNCNHHLNP